MNRAIFSRESNIRCPLGEINKVTSARNVTETAPNQTPNRLYAGKIGGFMALLPWLRRIPVHPQGNRVAFQPDNRL
jgi:hypothetical protein